MTDHGAKVNDWVNIVRRARLGPAVKPIALLMASYANPDGTSTYPGVARLAIQAEVSYSTAQRGLRVLRDKGLIEMTRRGARRTGKADTYRLILAADLLERCDVPTPAAELLAIARLADAVSTRHPRPVEPRSTRQGDHVLHVTPDRPPSIDPYMGLDPPTDESNPGFQRAGSCPGEQHNPITRSETETERKRQADALTKWMNDHPEALTEATP